MEAMTVSFHVERPMAHGCLAPDYGVRLAAIPGDG